MDERKFIINPANAGTPPASADTDEERKLPQYERDFGHVAEDIIISALRKKSKGLITNVEKATEEEDKNKEKQVDLWLEVPGIDPIAVQYYSGNNHDVEIKKKEELEKRHNLVKKEKREDAIINWAGNAHIVVITGNQKKLREYWEKAQKEKKDPGEFVEDGFMSDFFIQLTRELGKISTVSRDIVMKALIKANQSDKKKTGR